MNKKGSAPIFLIVILVVAVLIFVYLNKSTFITKTTQQSSTPNSGDFYKDLKVGLKKAF